MKNEMRPLIRFTLTLRVLSLLSLALLFVLARGTAQAAEPVFNLHFIGTEALADNPANASVFDIVDAPEGADVRKRAAAKLAAKASTIMAGVSSNTLSAALEDFLRVETCVQIHSLKPFAWSVALKVNPKRAGAWEGALRKGAKKSAGRVKIDRKKGWVGLGVGVAPTIPGKLDGLMRLQASGALFKQLLGDAFAAPPSLDLVFSSQKERVRTVGTLQFKDALKLDLEPFRWPENSLRDPLIGLNIVRGIRPWLAQFKLMRDWRVPKVPNQALLWTSSAVPFHTLMAVPFPKAASYLVKQRARVMEWLDPNLREQGRGNILRSTNDHFYGWGGLPIVAPFVGVAPEPKGDWLLAGSMISIVPQGTNSTPPPGGLLNQFRNRDDLIYYEWEITEGRLKTARWFAQISQMVSGNLISRDQVQLWLNAIGQKLGNCVTEITRRDDHSWEFTRSSSFGLNSTELALLGYWLENPDFPAFKRSSQGGPPLPFPAPAVKSK
jgi:hypothetical protein